MPGPAPQVNAFGDGSHPLGASGITISGAGFGPFAGSAWIYQNDDLTGLADELTVTSWADLEIVVTIPGSLNNAAGTRYVFVQRPDLAWSNALAFTLEPAAGTGSLSEPLDALTLSAVGTLPLNGALSATLGALTSSAFGASSAVGSLSKTLGSLTLSAAGLFGNALSGTANITLDNVTCTAEGDLEIRGTVNVTLGALTLNTRRITSVRTSRVFRSPRRNVHRAA